MPGASASAEARPPELPILGTAMTDRLGMRVDQPQLIPPLRMEIMEILRAGGPYINPLLVDEFIPYMNTEVLTQKTLRDEG